VAAVSKRLDSLVCGPIPEPSKIALAIERGAKILTAQEWHGFLAKGGARTAFECVKKAVAPLDFFRI
jgi:hypothetical protein